MTLYMIFKVGDIIKARGSYDGIGQWIIMGLGQNEALQETYIMLYLNKQHRLFREYNGLFREYNASLVEQACELR